MKEDLQQFLLNYLNFLPPEVLVIIISATPILEFRGGIPLAMAFGFPFWKALLLSLFGNIIVVLPILILFQPLSRILLRFNWYTRFYNWLYGRTLKKSDQVKKYGFLSLALFTAVPLPTTGAYSACAAASFFAIPIRYAFPAIVLGVVIAGVGVSFTLFYFFG